MVGNKNKVVFIFLPSFGLYYLVDVIVYENLLNLEIFGKIKNKAMKKKYCSDRQESLSVRCNELFDMSYSQYEV